MADVWTPRPYHPLMIDHVITVPKCMVFAFMGAGKTSAILAAVSALLFAELAQRVLVLAPLRVARSVWPEEVRKWSNFSHLRVAKILGDEGERRAGLRADADIFVCNYDCLDWLVKTCGANWPFDMIVADECTRLKSARTVQGGKRAGSLLKVMGKVKRFVGLTGTPSPNGLPDLYGQMLFVDRGLRLGRSFTAFENRWFGFQRASDAVNAWKTHVKRIAFPHAQDEIQGLLKDVCMTLAAEDWFPTDEPITTRINVDLPPAARKVYKTMEREYFVELEGHEIEAVSAAAKSQKLLQFANGAGYVNGTSEEWVVTHDEKIEALRSLVEESNGAPILVAYNFKSDLARLLKAFPQARHLDKREATIEEWNAGQIPMLVAHPMSAGHGLNLAVGGNILVFFGHSWSLENRMQIIERIGPVRQRQAGLSRAVYLYDLVARNTIDELVIERIASKRSVQDVLLAAMKRRHAD